jgi:hypothetical protein
MYLGMHESGANAPAYTRTHACLCICANTITVKNNAECAEVEAEQLRILKCMACRHADMHSVDHYIITKSTIVPYSIHKEFLLLQNCHSNVTLQAGESTKHNTASRQ